MPTEISDLFERKWWQDLAGLYSFLPAETGEYSLGNLNFDSNEKLIGVYCNTPEDLVIFTTRGVYQQRPSLQQFVPYDSIYFVHEPDNEEDRALTLILDDEEVVLLPILNETEELLDYYAVRYCLLSELQCPFHRYADKIATIETAADAGKFIRRFSNLPFELSVAFRGNYPTTRQLERMNIDPAILKDPNTWRLIAAFLSIGATEEHIIKHRAEWK